MKTDTSTFTATNQFTLKEKLLYGAMGLVVIGGSFFIGRSLIRNARATSEEKKTYQEGSPATFAKQIRMAFENDTWFGWGTDEELLRSIIRAIPSKDVMRQTINSYQKLYARSMMSDMQEELTTSEYNELLAIIAAKPDSGNTLAPLQVASPEQQQAWAKRLNAAFNLSYGFIPATDEEAIKTVFMEIPTQSAFWNTASTYKNLFGADLTQELKSELEVWEYPSYMSMIMKKPKA